MVTFLSETEQGTHSFCLSVSIGLAVERVLQHTLATEAPAPLGAARGAAPGPSDYWRCPHGRRHSRLGAGLALG